MDKAGTACRVFNRPSLSPYFLAKPFKEVQKRVVPLLKDNILASYAVHNYLKVRMNSLSSFFNHFLTFL